MCEGAQFRLSKKIYLIINTKSVNAAIRRDAAEGKAITEEMRSYHSSRDGFFQQKVLCSFFISTLIVVRQFSGPGKKLSLTSKQISNKPTLYPDPVGSPVVPCWLLWHGLKYETWRCDPKQAICMHEFTWTSLFFGHYGQNNAAPARLSGTWSRRAKSSKNTIV